MSDRGPDQSARRRQTSERLASHDSILYFPSDCYLHGYHNACKDALLLVDECLSQCFSPAILGGFKAYYSTVAKVTNLWREKAAQIMSAWDVHHSGDPEALKLGHSYPMSVVTGRWGSVQAAEDYLCQRGRQLVVPPLMAVLSKSMKASCLDDDYPTYCFAGMLLCYVVMFFIFIHGHIVIIIMYLCTILVIIIVTVAISPYRRYVSGCHFDRI